MSLAQKERFRRDGPLRLGKPHSDETKEKIRKSKKGRGVGKDNPFYGKKHSQESLKRMRESKLGIKHSSRHKKRISEGLKRAYGEGRR